MANQTKKQKYSEEFLLKTYKEMIRVRKFEETAAECFMNGMLAGNIHLGMGEEAIMVGACYALDKMDYILPTHRGHGQSIAKGATTDRMMAELFGKETGYCKGKGGSMHIADKSNRNFGANGILGACFPIAAGSALASKIKGTNEVTLCFFGDGTSNEGTFHEAINMAATWKLPVIYLCVNNGYGVSTAIRDVINTETISVRAKAYDIPGETIDGNDVFTVYETVKKAVDYAREGNGPSLIECITYRHQGHYCGDPANYRPKEYLEEAYQKDPIERLRKHLLDNQISEENIMRINEEIEEEIKAAVKFAQESNLPDVSEAFTGVYSSDNERGVCR